VVNNNFNLLRILGAVFVVIGHAYPLTGTAGVPSLMGHSIHTFGLIVFFSISGYLVMKSLDQSPNLSTFFAKRVARILPGLAVAVLASAFLLGPVFTSLSFADYFASPITYSYLGNIGLNITYQLPGVFQTVPWPNAVNGSLWTIPVEVACYLVLGLALIRFQSARVRLLIIGAVVVFLIVIIELWVAQKPVWVFYGTDWIISTTIMIFFFFGAALYLIPEQLLRLDIAVLGVIALLLLTGLPLYSSVIQPAILSYVIVCLGKSDTIVPNKFLDLGDPSYGAYLFAFPIQQIVVQIGLFSIPPDGGWALIGNTLLVAIISLALGYASWHIIEKPSLIFVRLRIP